MGLTYGVATFERRRNDLIRSGPPHSVVRPLQRRSVFCASFPWVSPTAIHSLPLRGSRTAEPFHQEIQNRGPEKRRSALTLTSHTEFPRSPIVASKQLAGFRAALLELLAFNIPHDPLFASKSHVT